MAIYAKTRKYAPPADVRPITTKRAAEFKSPSPAEVVPELGRLAEREVEIAAAMRDDRAELKLLEREIAVDDSPEIHPEVAKLLNDAPSPKAAKRIAIRDIKGRLVVADAALAEIQKRRRSLEGAAGKAVCDAVRPEVTKRVVALADALRAVDAAHHDLGEVLLAIEAEGVSWGALGPVKPFFLNDHREADRRIVSYLREIEGAGYAA